MTVLVVASVFVFFTGISLVHESNATLMTGVLLMLFVAPMLLVPLVPLGISKAMHQRLLETSGPIYRFADEGLECKLTDPAGNLLVSWTAISNYCVPILSMKQEGSTPPVKASGKIYVKVGNLDDIVLTECSEKSRNHWRSIFRHNARGIGGEVMIDTTFLDTSTTIHDNLVKRLTPEQIANSVLKLKNSTTPTQGILNIEP